MGPLLLRLARTCLDAGATPVVIHHATKGAGRPTTKTTKPLDLDDLAFAGIGEFSRQWLLVNRTKPYCPGSGEHNLLMAVGGSAGHSGCWRLQIQEGMAKAGFGGRTWEVAVRDRDDALPIDLEDDGALFENPGMKGGARYHALCKRSSRNDRR